jgi:hypothetical protein
MLRQRFLHMSIPVIPCVRTGMLSVRMRDAQFYQMSVEATILLDEEILSTAVKTYNRAPLGINPSSQ